MGRSKRKFVKPQPPANKREGKPRNLSDDNTAKTFHKFSQCPPEIQRNIWKHALPDRRVNDVVAGVIESDPLQRVSSVMRACKTAYDVAVKRYSDNELAGQEGLGSSAAGEGRAGQNSNGGSSYGSSYYQNHLNHGPSRKVSYKDDVFLIHNVPPRSTLTDFMCDIYPIRSMLNHYMSDKIDLAKIKTLAFEVKEFTTALVENGSGMRRFICIFANMCDSLEEIILIEPPKSGSRSKHLRMCTCSEDYLCRPCYDAFAWIGECYSTDGSEDFQSCVKTWEKQRKDDPCMSEPSSKHIERVKLYWAEG